MTATIWHENGRSAPIPDDELRRAALAMLEARRAMRGTLPEHLIHDVALEMLLSVYLAGDASIPARHLLDEAAVPTAAGRRWIDAIASEGLFIAANGAVRLSEEGRTRMDGMLTNVVLSQRRLLGWADH